MNWVQSLYATLRVVSAGAFLSMASTHAFSAAITDVDLQLISPTYENPSAVGSGTRNDKARKLNSLTGLFEGDRWKLLDRTNKDSRQFEDVTFTINAETGERSGSWDMSWSGTGLGIYMDIVLVTKAGGEWGAYLFESVLIDNSVTTANGNFAISWVNNRLRTPRLGRASIYGRLASAPDPVLISIPSSMGLMSLALCLVGAARRRAC